MFFIIKTFLKILKIEKLTRTETNSFKLLKHGSEVHDRREFHCLDASLTVLRDKAMRGFRRSSPFVFAKFSTVLPIIGADDLQTDDANPETFFVRSVLFAYVLC